MYLEKERREGGKEGRKERKNSLFYIYIYIYI